MFGFRNVKPSIAGLLSHRSILQSIQCLGWLRGFQETPTLEHMSKCMWVPHCHVFPWPCSLGSNNIRLAITLTFKYSKFLSTPTPEDWDTFLPPSSPVCQSIGDCGLTLPLSATASMLFLLQWSQQFGRQRSWCLSGIKMRSGTLGPTLDPMGHPLDLREHPQTLQKFNLLF